MGDAGQKTFAMNEFIMKKLVLKSQVEKWYRWCPFKYAWEKRYPLSLESCGIIAKIRPTTDLPPWTEGIASGLRPRNDTFISCRNPFAS